MQPTIITRQIGINRRKTKKKRHESGRKVLKHAILLAYRVDMDKRLRLTIHNCAYVSM